jgi:hypothetical protein
LTDPRIRDLVKVTYNKTAKNATLISISRPPLTSEKSE